MKQTDNIELCLKELGYAIVPTDGTSMWPLLMQGRTLVQVEAKDGKKLKKGDVVLYRKKDGTLVLHRIIKAEKKDTVSVLGDHQWKTAEQVREDQIIAVAKVFFRNGHDIDEKTLRYRLYKKIWNGNLTLRRCCLAFLRLSGIEKRSLRKSDKSSL